jgi:hypothetical protein
MTIPVAELDLDLAFLRGERDKLRQRPPAYWSGMKIDQFNRAIMHLEEVRREQQMTGFGGKRIEDPERPTEVMLPDPTDWLVQK